VRKQRVDAVLVLRFMRKHELELIIFFVYRVVPFYLHCPKRTSVAPHSVAQLQIVSSVSNDHQHRNRRQDFLKGLQIDLPTRDFTLAARMYCFAKKKPSAPEGTKGHSIDLQLALWLVGWRMQHAEAVSAVRPHQHQCILAFRNRRECLLYIHRALHVFPVHLQDHVTTS
jgi:hypothetical protein